MKPFKSYSQAGQDKFALAICPDGKIFLDVGCCHPTEISNTYGLEQIGWRGLLVDNDPGAVKLCREQRVSPVLQADAANIDWNSVLNEYLPIWRGNAIDFLSLDIDEASADALNAILNVGAVFNVICAEHDQYRNGDRLRDPMRKRLIKHDYVLVCADVCSSDGLPYEDWWVQQDLAEAAMRFKCAGKRWPEIFLP